MTRRRLLLICLTALLLAAALFFGPRPPLLDGVGFSRAVFDRHGQLLRLTLADDERYRLFEPLERISPTLIEATLQHEDRTFSWHPGVNPAALLRALYRTYAVGDRRVGGSTITMQLARLRGKLHTRTMLGKLEQIARALRYELHYSKDEILQAYLNLVPYGGNVEGVGAASRIYFDKLSAELTLVEALTLCAIPQSPSRRDPNRRPNAELTGARARIFERWLQRHPEDAVAQVAFNLPLQTRAAGDLPFGAPHFVDALLAGRDPSPVVAATIDLQLQQLLERHARRYVDQHRRVGIVNAAAMLVDHRSMEVLAELGSVDFFSAQIQGQVNGARARRSPGSALKPFIYALGLDQGLIHPRTVLKDTAQSFGAFNPENFDGTFVGPISAQDALVRSRNVPAVAIAAQLEAPTFYQLLARSGVGELRGEAHYGLATVLGGLEVTMAELVTLYAMLANNGELRGLRLTAVGEEESERPTLLSAEAAALTLHMLEHNPRPGSRSPFSGGARAGRVAWKTGTSYAFRDAWAVGVFGPYVLAVWVGNFDGSGNPALVGRRAAGPLFFEIVDSIASLRLDRPALASGGLEQRSGQLHLAHVEVCAVSGKLPGDHCPHRVKSWFIPGVSPIERCDVHRTVAVELASGMRACPGGGAPTRSEVYEFWPSDLLALFQRAGVPRRTPPPFAPGCELGATAGSGAAPQITSPQPGIVYSLRQHKIDDERIAFAAVSDAGVRELHWFVNQEYVGRSAGDGRLFWSARPGRHVVRVVDDHGRSNARSMLVAVVE